jgi:hypothetical protein
VPLSIDEAIQRIKAEIIAPDWRLSPKRIDSLVGVFAHMQERYRNRKKMRDIITMADNVLQYIKVKGDNSPPDSVDFLKEAMADIVNLHEEGEGHRDEIVFRKIYAHFHHLKEKIKTHKAKRQILFSPEEGVPGNEEALAAARTMAPLLEVGSDDDAVGLPTKEEPSPEFGRQVEAERLIVELQDSLQRAEEVGAALRQILDEALVTTRTSPVVDPIFRKQATVVSKRAATPSPEKKAVKTAPPAASIPNGPQGDPGEDCEFTLLQEISLGGYPIAIPAEGIALIKPLTTAACEKYLQEAQVSLGDFGGFFKGLSRQFHGVLAGVSNRKLKNLSLPVVFLKSFGIPEPPEEGATTLLVLSHGQWHGILFCTEVQKELRTMVKFRKAPNGDIAGIGSLEDGRELPVVNLADFLRREGFLALV